MPHRRRLRRESTAPYEHFDIAVRGLEAATSNAAFADYLASVNVRITSLGESQPLHARITHLSQTAFAHVTLPHATIEWPRDQMSLDRGLIMICRSGGMNAQSAGVVVRRNPGLIVIPPGDTHVTITADAPLNEVLYISVSASLMRDFRFTTTEARELPPVPVGALAPLFAFGVTVCAISVQQTNAVLPLQHAATEIARSMLQMVADGSPADLSLFAQAMRVMMRDYGQSRLSAAILAHGLGRSERTLQAAFTEQGTTIMRELRAVRVRAAIAIREHNPRATASEVARAVGFGSAASLFRALRDVPRTADADPDAC